MQEFPWENKRAEVSFPFWQQYWIITSLLFRHFRNSLDQNKFKDIDETFVKQFLNSTPTESVLIPTRVLSGLAHSLRQNKTYCFKTDPGPWGWCATCKVECELSVSSIQCHLPTTNIRSALRKVNLAFAAKKEILEIQTRSLFQLLPRLICQNLH